MAETPEPTIIDRIEAVFADLPPRTHDRLWQIILDHGVPPGARKPRGFDAKWESGLLIHRANVVQEHRSNGSTFWRLYIESGSRHSGNFAPDALALSLGYGQDDEDE